MPGVRMSGVWPRMHRVGCDVWRFGIWGGLVGGEHWHHGLVLILGVTTGWRLQAGRKGFRIYG